MGWLVCEATDFCLGDTALETWPDNGKSGYDFPRLPHPLQPKLCMKSHKLTPFKVIAGQVTSVIVQRYSLNNHRLT